MNHIIYTTHTAIYNGMWSLPTVLATRASILAKPYKLTKQKHNNYGPSKSIAYMLL